MYRFSWFDFLLLLVAALGLLLLVLGEPVPGVG